MGGMREKLPMLREGAAAGQRSIDAINQRSNVAGVPLRAMPAARPAISSQSAPSEKTDPPSHRLPDSGTPVLPDALAARLDRCSLPGRVPEQLVTAIWNSLQDDTHKLALAWELIPGGPGNYTASIAAATADRTRKLVTARFVDVGLIAATAIADPARVDDGRGAYFLHANHLALYCGVDFIAAQKPHRSEIGGFLQMLVEKNVGLVVDLTAASEREADATYAPAPARSICIDSADIAVRCLRRKRLPAMRSSVKSLVIRRAAVAQGNDAGHRLQRLHFSGWPDNGVIPSRMLRLLAAQVESLSVESPGPIVVHCMAGVGRSGTLISFIATRRRLRENPCAKAGTCTASMVAAILLETIAQGRRDRGAGFVQTREQFALVLTSLLEEFVGGAVTAQAASAGVWQPALTVSGCLGFLSDVVSDVVRQTAGRITARLTDARHGNDAGTGRLEARLATDTGGTAPMVHDTAGSSGRPSDVARAALTQHTRDAADVSGTFPEPVAARVPASVSVLTSAPTVAPAAPGPARPAAAAPRGSDAKMSACDARQAITQDTLLSACYDKAVALLGEVRNAGQIDLLLTDIEQQAQPHCRSGLLSDAQREILKAAVMQRFDRREKGIIFQAHLSRKPDEKALPTHGRSLATQPTPVRSTTLTDH